MNIKLKGTEKMEKLGEKIKGSRFIRVFCKGCNTPMRTTTKEIDNEHWCEICLPIHCRCTSPQERLMGKQKAKIGLSMKQLLVTDRGGNKTTIKTVQ